MNIFSKNSKNIYLDLLNVTKIYCEMVGAEEKNFLGVILKILIGIDPDLIHKCPLQVMRFYPFHPVIKLNINHFRE